MDGTVIDSEPLWLQAEIRMLERYGLELGQELHDRLIGTGLWAGAELFRELGVPLTADEIVAEWVAGVEEGLEQGEPLWRPGAVELLTELRDAGTPCALVTMSVRSFAEKVVSLLPDGVFSAIIAGDEVEHEKPHPDPYLRGAAALGVDIADCLAFEDSPTGARSARSAGAVTVGVPNMVALEESAAHEVWPSLAGVDLHTLTEGFARVRATDVSDTPAASGPFRYGDRVQLTGPKGRINTITLIRGGEFHSHRGTIQHADLVGLPDASVVGNSTGEEYLALRPLLSDFVMSMPRGAAIVYPKDAAQILSLADIFPGATVVEAGVGSGALSLHLLRAIGPEGRLHSFERRDEFAQIAQANAAAFAGGAPANWSVTVGDLQEQLPAACPGASVDRIVLDMLAPWECVGVAADTLKPGGVLICYVATVTQLSRTVEELRRSGCFTHPQASETMVRGWHVEGLAVRPDHRMVAHTGFLVTARRLAPGTVLPSLKRRASKSDFSENDMASWLPDAVAGSDASVWTPEAVGERGKSDKILRKKAREAHRLAAQTENGESPETV